MNIEHVTQAHQQRLLLQLLTIIDISTHAHTNDIVKAKAQKRKEIWQQLIEKAIHLHVPKLVIIVENYYYVIRKNIISSFSDVDGLFLFHIFVFVLFHGPNSQWFY